MQCNQLCRLFGAYQLLSGINDSIVLLHSVVGCHFATAMQSFSTRQDELNSCCSIISDKDVIFDGMDSLKYAIYNAIELYHPNSIAVITGCVSEVIKDDVESVIQSINTRIPIFYFSGAGFLSQFETGYDDCLLEYIQTYVSRDNKKEDNTINIFGTLKDDFKLKQNIKEIKRILGNKININCVIGDCSLEEISGINKATLNITFSRGISTCEYLKEKYNIPYKILDYPYGIQKSKEFLSILEGHFKVDFSFEKTQIEEYAVSSFKRIYCYIRQFYQLPVGVYVSKTHLKGLEYFLSQELGMNVLSADKSVCEYEEYTNKYHYIKPALLFASSFDGGLADDFSVPLFPVEYPVFSRISITEEPYVFGRGAVNMVNDLINMILTLKFGETKGAFYSEKNMHLW